MDDSLPHRMNDDQITHRLREAGLRATQPRLAVFRALHETPGHHSVDEIVDLLVDRDTTYPRMTVYNVVGQLTEAGLTMRADAGPGRALYEIADHWHHHFVCRQCGAVYDVPCIVGHKPCLQPEVDDIGEIDEAQIIFRGVCRNCLGNL